MSGRFLNNPAYVELEKLQRELHALIAQQQGDTSAADAVRDRMDSLAKGLTHAEQTRLDGLSADLYMLSGSELLERSRYSSMSVNDFRREILDACHWNDWDSVLSMLRQRPPTLPAEPVALSRSRAYHALQHLDAALLFLDYAMKHRAADTAYTTLRLMLLIQLNRRIEAAAEAKKYLADQNTPLDLLVVSVDTLLTFGETAASSAERAQYEAMSELLSGALSNSLVPGRRAFAIFGWILVGGCQIQLGFPNRAALAFERALRLAPTDQAILNALNAARSGALTPETQSYLQAALERVRAAAESFEFQPLAAA